MNPLQLAIDLSEQILQAVDSEQWERIEELEQSRQRLIQEYFVEGRNIDVAATRQLQQLNDRIVEHLKHQRQQTQQAQLALKQGNKATQAYRDIARK